MSQQTAAGVAAAPRVLGPSVPPGKTAAPDVVARVAEFAELGPAAAGPGMGSLDHLLGVTVTVTAELGRVTRSISDVLRIGVGSVLQLDRPVAEPVDLLVQGVRVARGEVMVVGDRFAVRITEIVDPKMRV